MKKLILLLALISTIALTGLSYDPQPKQILLDEPAICCDSQCIAWGGTYCCKKCLAPIAED